MLRNASIKDLDLIFNLIVEGSRDGHFHPDIARLPQAKDGFRANLTSILTSMRRLDADAKAYGLVSEVISEPVGFLLISSLSGNKGNEFWMTAVAKEHRGNGYASKLIDSVLEQFDKKRIAITARCAPASEAMFQMLLRRGFVNLTTSSTGTRSLLRL